MGSPPHPRPRPNPPPDTGPPAAADDGDCWSTCSPAARRPRLTLDQIRLDAPTATTTPAARVPHHPHLQRESATAEQAFDRLNPDFGVPADRSDRIGHRDVAQREAALALGVRVAVHDSRQNDPNPVIWQPGQDYRMADALHAARTQPTRARHGPERVGPER